MKRVKNITDIRYLKYLILSFFILPAAFVLAQLTMPDFGTPFDLNGWTINTVDTGTVLLDNSVRQIDAHGICKNVQATDGKQYFVPTKSSGEWNDFINNAGSGVNLSDCSNTQVCNSITWTKIAFPSSKWEQVAISNDGQKIAALDNSDAVYISTDGGNTYSKYFGGSSYKYYGEIVMSDDGLTILKHNQNGYIYITKDGGNTWRVVSEVGRPWRSTIAISPDGLKIAVAVYLTYLAGSSGYVYLSNDGGTTWVKQVNLGQKLWGDIEMVKSNPNIIYVIYAKYGSAIVYKTDNFGQTWNVVTTQTYTTSDLYPDIHVSDSGQYILFNATMGVSATNVYFSNDYGGTWKQLNLPKYPDIYGRLIQEYYDVVVNDSGIFCTRRYGPPPVCSYDGGNTFTEQSSMTGTGVGSFFQAMRGFDVNNNVFIVSGMTNYWSAGNVYIGLCNF